MYSPRPVPPKVRRGWSSEQTDTCTRRPEARLRVTIRVLSASTEPRAPTLILWQWGVTVGHSTSVLEILFTLLAMPQVASWTDLVHRPWHHLLSAWTPQALRPLPSITRPRMAPA